MRRIDGSEIDEIEAAALNAWPAAQQYLLDGYVVRFAQGYTKRANSVNRLRPPRIAPAELVPLCEDLYRTRGLPPIFRLIDSAESAALDGFLAQRGYQMLDQTAVMTCATAVAADGAAALQGAFAAQFVPMELDAWLDAYMRLGQAAPHTRAAHRAILQAIVPPRLFAALLVAGEPLACGMGVLDRQRFGLFDIVTHAAHRRQGLGGQLVRQMARWAQERGAAACYLQVVERNSAARSLYARLGFTDAYGYWYRIAPENGSTT
jgi:GNAT superfamily N-acetyltransferase